MNTISSNWNSKSVQGAVWGIVRLWLGYSWITGGWEKLTGGGWIDSKAGLAVGGFLKGALGKAGGEHPEVHAWYADLTRNFFIPNAVVFSYLVAFGEFMIGAALIIGLFTRFAAGMGILLNLAFLYAGTSSNNPEMLVAEVAIVFAGVYAGYYGLDRFVLPYLRRVLKLDGAAGEVTSGQPVPRSQPQAL